MSSLERRLDDLYDRLVNECPEPRANAYRAEFKAAEAEARERFERWKRETLEEQRRYHDLRGADKKEANERAHQDVLLLAIDAREELDRLVAYHWRRFTERLARLLEELNETPGEQAHG